MTFSELAVFVRNAQAAAGATPVIAANPYFQLGSLGLEALLQVGGAIAGNTEVPRPTTFTVEQWEALKAFTKTGDDYINEARKANPVDPSKIIQPSP